MTQNGFYTMLPLEHQFHTVKSDRSNCRIQRGLQNPSVSFASCCLRGQRTAGCGNSDTVSHLHSGCSPAWISPPRAASGSYNARTNSGRGQGKHGDGSTESCCHWHSNLPVCVHAYTCVCVRLPVWTRRLTVNPWAVCMICPFLFCVSSSARGQCRVTDRKWWGWVGWDSAAGCKVLSQQNYATCKYNFSHWGFMLMFLNQLWAVL